MEKPPKTLKEWRQRLHKIRVEAGRKGGQAKVKKGFATMTADRLAEVSKKGVNARCSQRTEN